MSYFDLFEEFIQKEYPDAPIEKGSNSLASALKLYYNRNKKRLNIPYQRPYEVEDEEAKVKEDEVK